MSVCVSPSTAAILQPYHIASMSCHITKLNPGAQVELYNVMSECAFLTKIIEEYEQELGKMRVNQELLEYFAGIQLGYRYYPLDHMESPHLEDNMKWQPWGVDAVIQCEDENNNKRPSNMDAEEGGQMATKATENAKELKGKGNSKPGAGRQMDSGRNLPENETAKDPSVCKQMPTKATEKAVKEKEKDTNQTVFEKDSGKEKSQAAMEPRMCKLQNAPAGMRKQRACGKKLAQSTEVGKPQHAALKQMASCDDDKRKACDMIQTPPSPPWKKAHLMPPPPLKKARVVPARALTPPRKIPPRQRPIPTPVRV